MTHIDKLRRALVRAIDEYFSHEEVNRYLHSEAIVRTEAYLPEGTERSNSVTVRLFAQDNPLPAVFHVIVRAKQR